MTISQANLAQSGSYQVHAINVVGQSTADFVLHVIGKVQFRLVRVVSNECVCQMCQKREYTFVFFLRELYKEFY